MEKLGTNEKLIVARGVQVRVFIPKFVFRAISSQWVCTCIWKTHIPRLASYITLPRYMCATNTEPRISSVF